MILADDYSGGDSRSGEPPAKQEGGERHPESISGSEPDAEAGKEPEGRVTEQEAIAALSSSLAAREELARSMNILDALLRRMGGDPTLRIGSINVFNDEIQVGEGDFTIGVGTPRDLEARREPNSMVPIDDAYIDGQTEAYVRPPGFRVALDILGARNLLILSGPRGTGRKAAALALLLQVCNRRQLKLLAGSALLVERGWTCGAEGTGFLVTLHEPAAVGRVDDVWLQQTAQRLKDTGNYMVVVTGTPCGSLAAAASRPDFVFEELGVPDTVSVMRKRAQLTVSAARAGDLDLLLARADVAEVLGADNSPRFAARVAVLLAKALNDGQDMAAVLQALRNPADQVQAWFERYDRTDDIEYRQIVLPIAVSVLEDSSYLTVTDAATMLYQRLFPDLADPPPLRFRRALREHHRWIELAEADEAMARYMDTQSELLRFRSPLIRPAVLQYAWTWLDGIRPALGGWLGDLVRHPDVDVRARAATATGLLATLDFSYALHQFLHPWAVGSSAAARGCAALALSVPGHSPRHQARVWALLRQWAAEAPGVAGRRLACTAAQAVGGILGRDQPHDAFNVLNEVLKRDEWESLTELVLAVVNLAENGCAADVLMALLDWSEPDDGSAPVIKALAAFALTARIPTYARAAAPLAPKAHSGATRLPSIRARSRLTGTAVTSRDASMESMERLPGPPSDGDQAEAALSHRSELPNMPRWPALLKEAKEHPAAVRDLWGRALAAKPVRPLALEALRDWLELADRDDTALLPVSRVIRSVAGLGGKHPDRIEYYLDRWGHDPKKPIRAAQRLLA